MLSLESDRTCPECSDKLLDVEDEFVCSGCGVTQPKEVLPGVGGSPSLQPIGRHQLGSYMGTMEITMEERRTKGITGSNSNYEYLKVVSDFAGRNEGSPAACAKMIERVGEKLCLPRVTLRDAAAISRKIFAASRPGRRVTVAAVSAYSLIAACKVEGNASVSIPEILQAHASLGKRVTTSSIIQLSLESPVKTLPRTPLDYLSRVLARLSMSASLAEDLSAEGEGRTRYFNSLRETAKELLISVGEEARAGRRPCALAASAVYSAEMVLARRGMRRKRLTQRDVAECGDTAEYTVREQCASIFAPAVEAIVTRTALPLELAAAL